MLDPHSSVEDDINIEEKANTMGATRNINATRITALQERKKHIEDTLTQRNLELRELCIQEAELTGITPPEMPLEPGETAPLIRRRVGTAYQLPEKLIKNANNNKDEMIAELELQIQVHANMADAALGLANEHNMSKTMKRQHRTEYQKYKKQCMDLQEKLSVLKERAAAEHLKQKKKLRTPDAVDDNMSLSTIINDPYGKSDARHSLCSLKHNVPSTVEYRYPRDTLKPTYRLSEIPHVGHQSSKQEDLLNSGFYRLSLNGYNKYMERRENINNIYPSPSYSIQHQNVFQYNMMHNYQMQSQQQHTLHYQHASPHTSQHSPHLSQHSSHSSQHSPHLPQNSPHLSRHSPHLSQHSPHLPQHSPHLPQHSPHLPQHSPQVPQHSPHMSQHSPHYAHLSQSSSHSSQHSLMSQHSPQKSQHSPQISHRASQYQQYASDFAESGNRQSSPTASLSPKSQYYPSHAILSKQGYRQYESEVMVRNPHQIQPHQQYEQMNVTTSGLGGYWKKTGNGEHVWYSSNMIDAAWQPDKRFGSLDRRKTKKMTSRISPNIDNKSATLSSVPNYQSQVRSASVKTSQVINRRSQDEGQLVRTQSLGSVGAVTVDSVYPTDDSSSFGSDNRPFDGSQTLKRHKEKEWVETSLDGPVAAAQPRAPTPQRLASPPLRTDEKPAIEIPAESNPSLKTTDPNIEILNNNIPKNCMVVQAGHCKPYHEETKPFEMSDFYKYSTKFKKSPVKRTDVPNGGQNGGNPNAQRSLGETFEENSPSPYSPTSPIYTNNMTSRTALEESGSLNASLDLEQIAVSEHFSDEMNAWYKDQRKNNNNTRASSKSRSTATLV
ncbi:unnamed protein product [Phaedon cochleariae]|uniref:Cytohesin Ubiquitin Protein Inducing domain-containing protein n=1 Tax=Phaedon cochleariae TaxID=80249 RepID=A0A9N9SEQ8_PHACE|nr:unnamed protein product [Phaedon cochleariae]